MDRREILERVASGSLSPEEADEALRGLDTPTPQPEPVAPPSTRVRRVKVTGGFGAIAIDGDDSVTEAEIDGAHSATVDGDTLVITAEHTDFHDGGSFKIDLGGRRRRMRRVHGGPGTEGISSLRVRVNPTIALEVKLDAGALAIRGMHGPIRARASAGPVTIEDVRSPIDVGLNAGAIRVSGTFTDGDSRIRNDAGAVRVEVASTSSVQIFGDSALGRVVLPGHENTQRKGGLGAKRQVTIGAGDATLRIETAMGSVNVTTF